MTKSLFFLMFFMFLIFFSSCKEKETHYSPEWESVNRHEAVPEWFKDAKFGIYFHWGVYSVPAFNSEWYPRFMYEPGHEVRLHHTEVYGDPDEWGYHNFILGAKDKGGNYVEFKPKLKSEGGEFDPDEWARLFREAGARFAGPVAEHHDGYSMWASNVNPWNAGEKGPKLDLVKLLTDAIRKENLKIITSLHHALSFVGPDDQLSSFYQYAPPQTDPELQKLYWQLPKEECEKIWLAKLTEVIDNYQPDIIWQDVFLSFLSDSIRLKFLSYYYNKAIDWNKKVVTTYKDGFNQENSVLDYERGGPPELMPYYWLTDDAISPTTWSYTTGMTYYTSKAILHSLIDRVSKNGNMLLNVSPTAEGCIPEEQKKILLDIGNWLRKYGEAIYSTRAWEAYGEGPTLMGAGHGDFIEPSEGITGDIRFTKSKNNKSLYVILLGWPEKGNNLSVKTLSSANIEMENLKKVEFLEPTGEKGIDLSWTQDESGMHISLPENFKEEMAWVIKLSFKKNIPLLKDNTI